MGTDEGPRGAGPPYTPAEMMATVAARELRDGEVVFVGIGLPNLACNLARATHAPRLLLIYESGAVGAEPERLPVSIGDPSLVTGSLMVCGMADVFQFLLQNGRIEVGFLGGAQIDRYGNINTTVVPGAGPVRVVTDKGILEPDPETGELVLAALYPSTTVDEVRAGVGWPLRCHETLHEVEPPGDEDLRLLRDVLDPHGLYLRS